jgi:putative ABC transport system permease protein
MSESFLLTLFSFLMSIFLVELILPSFNSFFERELHYSFIDDLTLVLWLIALFLLVSLFSGSYPAFLLSSFRPLKIIDRTVFIKQGKVPLRNLFVVLQFTISIILIISTITIKGQLEHIFTTDVGYKKNQIVTLEIRGEQTQEKLDIIKSELKKNPNILMTSSSTYLPNWIRDQTDFNWPGKPDHIKIRCYVSFVDNDYIDLFGIQIINGRNFSRDYPSDQKGAFILNETAVKELGWKEPLMHQLTNWDGRTGQVVGIVKDFNLHSLHRKIDPLYLFFEPEKRNYFLSLKIAGSNLQPTLDFIKKKMTHFAPEYPVEYNFFDDIFNKTYHKERRMDNLFTLFAIIAIIISCLGLFGLTLYTTEKRTKEIGIRKVLGASSAHIFSMLSREFTKWILLANFIAWPIAGFFMHRWLENFAYRIEMNLWIFLAAGGMTLLFALITVCYQALKAAVTNPIEALRYE